MSWQRGNGGGVYAFLMKKVSDSCMLVVFPPYHFITFINARLGNVCEPHDVVH